MANDKRPARGDLPALLFATPAEWQAWLDLHHASAPGVWLRLAKKGAATPTPTYDQALEVALCYGWIDSQKRAEDEQLWQQKFTPRGARSIWSKINCAKAEALIAAGRMHPAGLAEVERARQDGRWDAAYDAAGSASVPDDLQAALDASPAAREFFATIDRTNRYAILFRIQTAKKPETRAKRIAQFVAMLERHELIY
ncbi:YdeI/OmpD-associated family protein [Kouleothrix sp.]|uniref:YdeI/OmpD-associated family protein n=1 Tax=Kouleothrix sp. TaxID=2779161 RepID=UPI00391BA75F